MLVGRDVVMGSHLGPGKQCLGILLGLLLHSWLVISLFGIVLRSLLGGIPTWRLPAYGQVAELVSEGEEVGVAQVEPGEVGVAWVSGAGRVGKRVRLNRHTLVFQGSVGVQSRSRIWKRLCIRVVASNDRIYFCS